MSSSFTSAHLGLSLLEIWILALVLFRISFMIDPLFPIIHPITLDGTRSLMETGLSSSSFIFSCSSRTASTATDCRSLNDYKINTLHENYIFMIKRTAAAAQIQYWIQKGHYIQNKECGQNESQQNLLTTKSSIKFNDLKKPSSQTNIRHQAYLILHLQIYHIINKATNNYLPPGMKIYRN